jgi:sialate O-acetylesterase
MSLPHRTRALSFILACLMGASAVPARAEVKLPQVIGENMVLQRGEAVPIWGDAAPGEQVSVKFAGQTKSATADAAGKWRVNLDALQTSATPSTLTVAGSNTIELKNILVGEVWLCGGQSNMEFNMGGNGSSFRATPPLIEARQQADKPQIRLFLVKKNERAFTTDGWQICTPDTVAPFSAVAYFFGKELQEKLNVPVGLVESCWGGSHIERWTPAEAYERNPVFASQATSKPVRIDNQRAGQYFEPMIRPLIPFAVRGAIWYQGESNIINSNDRMRYVDKFKTMIDAWRSLWGEGDFPFYTVQIAPYYYTRRNDPLKHSEEELPYLWEAQVACLKLPNVGLAATTDLVDSFSNIHPPNKWDVGHRLALIALARTYGIKDLAYSGPIFKSAEFRDGKAIIHFDFTGAGKPQLGTSDGKAPTEFTIAGADHNFIPATAEIDGDSVLVHSDAIKDPKAVHFGWHETAQPNLIDANSKLPAIPFRTDRDTE